MALLFEKASTRTRVSMEMAVVQLGGHPVTLRGEEVGVDAREPAEDVAKVLSGYCAALAARVYHHERLVRMASAVGGAGGEPPVRRRPPVPDAGRPPHPAPVLRPAQGPAPWPTSGDGNNVCRSLMKAAPLAGLTLRVATPPATSRRRRRRRHVEIGNDPMAAVAGADAVYTDVWASMGQEGEAVRRREDFAGFTVDDAMMAAAAPQAVFLHCLPAHRGEEVSASVIDGPRSVGLAARPPTGSTPSGASSSGSWAPARDRPRRPANR